MIEVEKLNKSFKKVHAVKDLSFKVRNGEILGLIGPNGSGKTTTLKCMCTLLRPDSGRIILNKTELAKDPVKAKEGLAYVPEIPNPFFSLTVDEQIKFTARFFKIKNWMQRAEELLDQMDLLEALMTLWATHNDENWFTFNCPIVSHLYKLVNK